MEIVASCNHTSAKSGNGSLLKMLSENYLKIISTNPNVLILPKIVLYQHIKSRHSSITVTIKKKRTMSSRADMA